MTNRGPYNRKRILNLDDQDITGSRRQRVEGVDEETKAKAHEYCWLLYERIAIALRASPEQATRDPLLSIMIMKQAESVHNVLRQVMNGYEAGRAAKFTEESAFTYWGVRYSATAASLKKAAIDAAEKVGWKFEKPGKWIGSVQPIMALWLLFGERFKEARIAPDEMLIKYENGVPCYRKLSELGIPASHRQYASGINYSLPVKSALSQSLGPLTIAVMLALADPNKKYTEKWEKAFKRVFSYLSGCDQVCEVLKQHSAKACTPIVTALASIVMVIGGRDQGRIAFPPCALYSLMSKLEQAGTDAMDTSSTSSARPVIYVFDPAQLKVFNFSGRLGFFQYKRFQEHQLLKPLCSQVSMAQVVFHAMFGSYQGDLGLLSRITNEKNWRTRSELNEFFAKTKPSKTMASTETFAPIQLKVYSKLAGSLMVSLVNNSSEQTNAKTIFSGKQTKIVTPSMRQLMTNKATNNAVGGTVPEVVNYLNNYFEQLVRAIGKDESYSAGTSDWFEMGSLTAEADGVATGSVYAETGRLYWNSYDEV